LITAWVLRAGVYDRATATARKVTIGWPQGLASLLEKCAKGNDPRTKLTGWACLFGDVVDEAQKLDAVSVRTSSAVVLDLDEVGHQDNDPDNAPRSVEDVVELVTQAFPGIGFAYWETWRSRPGAIRMRLLFPLLEAVPANELHRYWAHIAMRLVQAGIPGPDKTSREPSRVHLLPTVHGAHGLVDGTAFATETTAPALGTAAPTEARRTRRTATAGARTHLAPDTILEWERGGTALLGALVPEVIEQKARAGEPNKARCRCPVYAEAASYSAFVRYHRGVLFVVCTSGGHSHAAGATWVGGVVTADPTSLPLPHPYSQSTTGALLKETGRDQQDTAVFVALAYTVPRVTIIYLDDETGDEWWKLEWEGHLGPSTVTLRRDEAASASKLIERAGRAGLDINETNKRELTKFLSDFVSHNRTRIQHQSVSSRMGWFGRGFLWGRTWLADPFGVEQPKELVVAGGDGRAQLANALRAEGTFAGWCDGAAALGPYPLVLAGIFVSVASCLVELVNTQSCVFEWASPSGTGKTTSLAIAASVWGHPEELQSSWDGTKVSLEQNAAFLSAIPMMLDDTKTVAGSKNSIDPEWAIYRVTSGEGRQRAAPGGQTRQTAKWALNMLTTGEEPVYGSGQSGGARARLISVQDPPYGLATKDSVSRLVGPLCAGILPHYGHAGPAVAYLAARVGHDKLRQAWAKRREYWIDYLKGRHSAYDRISNHLAMLDLAGTLLKQAAREAGTQALDALDVRAVLVAVAEQAAEVDRAAGEVDPVQRAKTEFYSWCVAHRASFWTTSATGTDLTRGPARGWMGRWDGAENWTDIYTTADAIQKFIDEAKYSMAARMLASQWIKDGFMTAGPERATWKVRIAGSPDWCYRIERRNCAVFQTSGDEVAEQPPVVLDLEFP
jgi:hypothetical protein